MRNTVVGVLAALAAFCMAPQAGHAALQTNDGNLGNILLGDSASGVGAVGQLGPLLDLSDDWTFTTPAPTFTAKVEAAQADLGNNLSANAIEGFFNSVNPLNVTSATLSGNGGPAQIITLGSTVLSFASIVGTNTVTFAVTVAGTFPAEGVIYRLSVTAVPLPAALPLLATALGGLWYQRRRKSAATA